MKILIAIPSNRQFRAKTVESLANLVAHTKAEVEVIVPVDGYNTAENRNYSVAYALKNGFSHILFSDDDMAYPKDALNRLLEQNKDAIGALYSVRREKRAFVVEYANENHNDEWAKAQELPFECNAIGTGFLLVKTEVFTHMQSPFFGYKWYNNGMVKMSTDWFACEKMKNEAKISIWADPTLQIKHIGEYEY